MNVKVIIMRGCSGSGKSTYIKKYMSADDYVVSNDDYFLNDGVYVWDLSKINDAIDACVGAFIFALVDAVDEDLGTIWVDNTNTRPEAWNIYTQIARAMRVPVEFVEIRCDPKIAAKRTSHGTTELTCSQQYNNMIRNPIPPKYKTTIINYAEDTKEESN